MKLDEKLDEANFIKCSNSILNTNNVLLQNINLDETGIVTKLHKSRGSGTIDRYNIEFCNK